MRCPKCGYNSFDHLENCKKCGKDLSEHKSRFGIRNILLSGVAMAPEAPVESDDFSAFEVAPEPAESASEAPGEPPAAESDDLGFDFMGDSDDEESLAFDELFEETALEDDIDETLPAPDRAEEALPEEPLVFDLGEPDQLDSEFSRNTAGGIDEPSFDLSESESLENSLSLDTDLGLDNEIDFTDFDEDDIIGTEEDPKRPFDRKELPPREESPTTVAGELPEPQLEVTFSPPPYDPAPDQPATADDPFPADDDFQADPFTDDEELPLLRDEFPEEPVPEAPERSFDAEPAPSKEPATVAGGEPPEPQPELTIPPRFDPAPDQPATADNPFPADDDFQADPFADDGELPLLRDEFPEEPAPEAPEHFFDAEPAPSKEPATVAGGEPPEPQPELTVPPRFDPAPEAPEVFFDEDFSDAVPAGGSDDFSLGALPVAPLSEYQEGAEPETPDPADEAEPSAEETDAEEPAGSQPPPFGRRIGAFLCDMLLLGLVGFCFVIVAETALSEHPDGIFPSLQTLIDLSIPYFLVVFCLTFGYFTLFHFLAGQTPGKMVAGIQVETTGGESLALSEAFMRSVGGLIQILPAGLGSLSVLLDREGRGWNDRLAGTRLVDLKRQLEEPRAGEGLAEPEEG